MTLYEAIREAMPAAEMDHHESDLYVRSTPTSRAIIREHGAHAEPFIDAITGQIWLDIGFAYDPYWIEKFEMRNTTL